MIRTAFIVAFGVLLGMAIPGTDEAQAASAISSPALALAQKIDGVRQSNIVDADVRIYIGPRYRRYRRHRYYRRYYRPRHIRRYYLGHRYGRGRRYGRCGYWRRQCGRNWGFGGANYRGCLRYHGCR